MCAVGKELILNFNVPTNESRSTTIAAKSLPTGRRAFAHCRANVRALTREYRDKETSAKRRVTLRRELGFYGRRIRAMWTASICLYSSLLCFLITVLSLMIISATNLAHLDLVGEISLSVGVLLVFVTVIYELVEVRLGVHTSQDEMSDALDVDS